METTTSNSATAYRILQVSNVSPMASHEQMHSLFTYIGKVAEIVVYNANKPDPLNPHAAPPTKICFVTFENPGDADLALHLHQTVFMDRPMTVAITGVTAIPSEEDAQKVAHLISALTPNTGHAQASAPADPTELQRTVYVENVPPATTAEEFLQFLQTIGEVKYLRFAGSAKSRTALVEFSTVQGAQQAMLKSGTSYKDKQLTIAHSATAISKPEGYVNAETQSDVMFKLKEVEHLIGNFAARVTGSAPTGLVNPPSSLSGRARGGTHEPASVSGAAADGTGSSRRRDSRSCDDDRCGSRKASDRRRSPTRSPSHSSKRDRRRDDDDRGRRDESHRVRDRERRYEKSSRRDDYYEDDRDADRRSDHRRRDYERRDERYVDERYDERRSTRRRHDDGDEYADDHKYDKRDDGRRHRSDRHHRSDRRRYADDDLDDGTANDPGHHRSSKRKTHDDEPGSREGSNARDRDVGREKSKRSKHSRRIKEDDEEEVYEKKPGRRDDDTSRSPADRRGRKRRDRRKEVDDVDDVSMEDSDEIEEKHPAVKYRKDKRNVSKGRSRSTISDAEKIKKEPDEVSQDA